MRLDGYDAYTAWETLGYEERNTYVAAAKRNEQIHTQITKASQ